MAVTKYDTNLIEMYNAVRSGKPFVNTLGTIIKDTTALSNETVGVITNLMDEYIAGGGTIGDQNWITLNKILTILDAPYLGSGSYAQPTVYDNLYPPLKYLLSNNGDISAVVQGMGIPLPGILNHTNTITESLPNILNAMGMKNSISQSLLNKANAVETCLSQTEIMGLLLGLGQKLLNTVNTVIKSILGLALLGIAALLAGINALLEPLKKAVSELYNQLIKENKALQELYKFLEDYALASVLAITRDPCIAAIVNAVGSEKVKSTFMKLRKIEKLEDFPLLALS